MKYVIVVGSGMADTRLVQLAGKTPMEVLALNSFDRCAGCFCGRVLTIPRGMEARADVALLSILGYDPKVYFNGASVASKLPAFADTFGLQGSVIAADARLRIIAGLMGLKTPEVDGATGTIDTNYEGKVECALKALQDGDDFALVHVGAPETLAAEGDLGRKMEAVQNVEYRVVMPLLNRLMGKGEDFRLLLVSDFAAFLTTQKHAAQPMPYAIFDSRVVRKAIDDGKEPPVRKFCEDAMLCEPVLMEGTDLIKVLLEQYMKN
ncbi:MAG: hypothetical protein IKJ26_05405 [Clostridia bacterium]|nr:hypothetical protein [Clostridia bacterium]